MARVGDRIRLTGPMLVDPDPRYKLPQTLQQVWQDLYECQ
jgi:hypothetical protein